MRFALPEPQLIAPANRLASGAATEADATLLEAFDADDLAAAGTTAADLVDARASALRVVPAAVARGQDEPEARRDQIPRAADTIRRTTSTLKRHLVNLPGPRTLQERGERIEQGRFSDDDLVVVHALPAAHLRTHASARHYSTFVDYRLQDGA